MSAFRVLEELARIDSAAGWNVALANSIEPFGAWFSDTIVDEVFSSPFSVLAGAFFPSRRAVPVDGGYLLSGRCGFNSNCHAANWVLGLAHVYDDGVERLGADGEPVTLLTLFPMEEATIVDNWDTLGMRGTGSHDVEVRDLFIPFERAIAFEPLENPSAAYRGPLHRLTVWPPVACDAIPSLGVAQAAIDAFVDLATHKTPSYTSSPLRERSIAQLRFAKAVAKVESARAFLHEAFDSAWQGALDGHTLDLAGKAPPSARLEPRSDRGRRGRRPDPLARGNGGHPQRPGVPAPLPRRPRADTARVRLREPHGGGRADPLRPRTGLGVLPLLVAGHGARALARLRRRGPRHRTRAARRVRRLGWRRPRGVRELLRIDWRDPPVRDVSPRPTVPSSPTPGASPPRPPNPPP